MQTHFFSLVWTHEAPKRLLLETMRRLDVNSVEKLLACGFLDVDVRDDDGMTPLMHIATGNPFRPPATDSAEILLQYCNVNLTDNCGRTALHCAMNSTANVLELLLKHGADPNLQDHAGLTPLDYIDDEALTHDSGRMKVLHLLEAGSDPFAVPPMHPESTRRCIYDRWMTTSSGQAFVEAHPEYLQPRKSA